ncbi:MAG: hypothetical protein WBF88_17570 [Pusillimonas sp.]
MHTAARLAGWCFVKEADGMIRMIPMIVGQAQQAPAKPSTKTGRDLYIDAMWGRPWAPAWRELSDEDQADWNTKAQS